MAKLSLGRVSLLSGLLLVAILQNVKGQVPVIDLFEGGGNEGTFFVPAGSGVPYILNFVTNRNPASLVRGNVDRVVVTLHGGLGMSSLERIEADSPPGTTINIQVIDDVYEFRLIAANGNMTTTEQYGSLLASLRHISTLPEDEIQAPPRDITIVAYGNSNFSESSTARLIVLPFNPLPPIIEDRIIASVDENAPNGAMVIQLNATDPEGLDVIFSFQSTSSIFAISLGGAVTVLDTSSLDYESPIQRRFELTVIVTDTDPISSMSSESTLVINVNNANDNTPHFTSSTYNFNVTEEVANVEVGMLSATDDDQEPNTNTLGTVFYDFFDSNNEIVQNFELNRGTGIITVRPPGLDYETTESYSFQVQVTDGIFTDTATVLVRVEDIPDNRPVLSPSEKTILINLDANQREIFLTDGSGGQLMVTDPDSPSLQDGVARVMVDRGAMVSFLALYQLYCLIKKRILCYLPNQIINQYLLKSLYTIINM